MDEECVARDVGATLCVSVLRNAGKWSSDGFMHYAVVKSSVVSEEHTASIFRVTELFQMDH
jgi:hypothetical protein